jgi:hypothetical protein
MLPRRRDIRQCLLVRKVRHRFGRARVFEERSPWRARLFVAIVVGRVIVYFVADINTKSESCQCQEVLLRRAMEGVAVERKRCGY